MINIKADVANRLHHSSVASTGYQDSYLILYGGER